MSKRTTGSFIYISILFVCIISCEQSFEPLNENIGFYSVYGYLDSGAGESLIRVNDLNKPLIEGGSSSFDGIVTLEHLDSGLKETLVDSLIYFNRIATHNFKYEIPLSDGSDYLLTVVNAEGNGIELSTRTPNRINEVTYEPTVEDNRGCGNFLLSFYPVDSGGILLEITLDVAGTEVVWQERIRTRIIDNRINLGVSFGEIGRALSRGDDTYCSRMFGNTVKFKYSHLNQDLLEERIDETIRIPGGLSRFGALYSDTFELEFNF